MHIVELTLDATKNSAAPVTQDRLFGWQAALSYTGRSDLSAVKVGGWCDDAHGPMQVINMTIMHFSAALPEA